MRISDWSSDVCSSDLPLEARDVGSLRIEAVAHPPRCQAVGEALTAAKGCGGIEMLAGKLSHFCANVIRHGDEPACRRRIGGSSKLRRIVKATPRPLLELPQRHDGLARADLTQLDLRRRKRQAERPDWRSAGGGKEVAEQWELRGG